MARKAASHWVPLADANDQGALCTIEPEGQVVAGPERVGMVGAEDSAVVLEQGLELPDRLLHPPRLPQEIGQVVAGPERVGVVGAEGGGKVEGRLEQGTSDVGLPDVEAVDRSNAEQGDRVLGRRPDLGRRRPIVTDPSAFGPTP